MAAVQRFTRAVQILLDARSQELGRLLDQASQCAASQRHETRIFNKPEGIALVASFTEEMPSSSSGSISA